MKKQVIAMAVGLVLVGTAICDAYWVGINQGGRSTPSSMPASPVSSLGAGDIDPKTGKKVLYWYDPVAPGQRFDKPGKPPFMDMQLVPIYAEGDSGASGITVDSRAVQNLGIHTAEVKAGQLSAALEAPGSITIGERNVQVIQARTNAFTQHVAVRTTLDPVQHRQALVTLYSPDWVVAQEEYLAVLHQSARGQAGLASVAKARMLQAGMTPGQVSAVEASGRLQPSVGIASPIDGIVTEVAVQDGMTVSPDMTLLRLADLDQVWVVAEVPEGQARTISPGLAVKVLSTGAAESLVGKIDTVSPDANPAMRTIKVRTILSNKGRYLLPGMFIAVRFDSGEQQDVLTLPLEAVICTGQCSIVMVDGGQAGFVATEIKTGREAAGMVEILAGLKADRRVVISGQLLIDSEASLRGTTERMATPATTSTPAAATTEHEGVGRIEAVMGEGLTISYGPIPSIQWGVMTMEFRAPSVGLPKGLKPGDRVRFRFHLDKDGMAALSSVVSASTDQGGKP